MSKVQILNPEEALEIPLILEKRARFQRILRTSISHADDIFSNSLLIKGVPGSGKTHSVMNAMERFKNDGIIHDYVRAAGHITPLSLYQLLQRTASDTGSGLDVLILDDVDCLGQEGCLELMKAAFDTKSNLPTNRQVYYRTDSADSFKYNGFAIIITNNEFDPDRITIHQQALLDRTTELSIDLNPNDMFIYNTYLIENYINDPTSQLGDYEKQIAKDLYDNEVRHWHNTKAFERTGETLSLRMLQKMIDSVRLFGNDWKDLNSTYKKLEAAAELVDNEFVSKPISDRNEVKHVRNAHHRRKNRKPRSDKGKKRGPKQNKIAA